MQDFHKSHHSRIIKIVHVFVAQTRVKISESSQLEMKFVGYSIQESNILDEHEKAHFQPSMKI